MRPSLASYSLLVACSRSSASVRTCSCTSIDAVIRAAIQTCERPRFGVTLDSFHLEEVIDLVLEPRDRVIADIDVQGEFPGRLKPFNMHARPADSARSEVLIREESSAGLPAGDLRAAGLPAGDFGAAGLPAGDFGTRQVPPRSLMSRGVYLYGHFSAVVGILMLHGNSNLSVAMSLFDSFKKIAHELEFIRTITPIPR